MKQRLSDNRDESPQTPLNEPFVERHPLLDPWKILSVIIVCFFAVLIAAYRSDTMGSSGLVAALTSVFLGLLFYFGLVMIRAREVILSGEFQNALFSGANNAGIEFSIITDVSGRLKYLSPGCRRYFAANELVVNRDLFEDALRKIGLEELDKIHVLSAFQANMSSTRHIELRDAFGFLQDIFLVCRPIDRPHGYYMLKAIRLDQDLRNDITQTTNPALLGLIDSLPFPAYLASMNGHILHANEALETLLGYDEKEITVNGLTLEDLFFGNEVMQGDPTAKITGPVAFRHQNNKKPIKAFLYQRTLGTEDKVTEKLGRSLLFGVLTEHSQTSLTGLSANANGISSDPQDIDKAMIDIWLSAIRYAPIPIAFLDKEGMVTQCNKALCTLSGKEAAHGWSIFDIIPRAQRDLFYKHLNDLPYEPFPEKAMPIEITIAGTQERIALLYASIIGKDGYIVHMVDVTQQKRFEQGMVQSQKMQAVGQLAGGIAHDFNNLLTAMIGFCDLLLMRQPAGDPSFPDIMQIKQNANRAANLVKQLLAFSRKQTLQPEVLDVTDTLAELSNLIRRLIGEHIELKIVHGRNLNPVKVDKIQFEQVVINLAVNARDAMGTGGLLTLTTDNVVIDESRSPEPHFISAAADDVIAAGDYVLIEVSDTGSGIPPDIVPRIFDPFFSTKETGSGTGLGLATVYGIIKQTGGYIYLSSTEGEGTVFRLYLPKASEEDIATAKAKAVEIDIPDADLTGKETILLVEDEAPVRMFSVRALQNKGYKVLEAENGQTALNIMQEKGGTVDLIITDVMMPGMDGPSLIKQVRMLYPKIKVIFISGYGEDAFVKTYGSSRDFNFLPKPYNLKSLAAKVKDVLR